ncbi:MAG: Rrf2 family transcriptional regulator [Candidatus Omnitrophota bacterium]
MKLITRDTDYAVRALCYIANRPGEFVPVPELVKRLKVPRPFLRKILQILNKKGILSSTKGKGGGFKLLRRPRNISAAELIKIFQGPLKINECLFKKSICPNIKTCLLKKKIDSIERYVVFELSNITIEGLIQR